MKIRIIFLLLFVEAFVGCKKDKKSTPLVPISLGKNVLNQNAHIVDTSAIANVTATSVTLNKGNMTFNPAVGDVLIASPSAKDTLGLFVKILSIANSGNSITCSTEISNLNDAFKELYINYTYTGAYSATSQANHNKQNILQPSGSLFAATSGTTLSIPFDNKKISGFILNGSLNLNIPDTRIKYVKGSGSTLPDTVLIAADLNTSGSQLEITSPTTNLKELTLYTFNLPTLYVPITIGLVVIPIPFTQTVKINILPASVSGKMFFTVLPQISTTLGLSYENGTWKNLSSYSIGASADSLIENKFSASVTATATVFNPVYTIAPFGSDANNLFFEIPNDLGLTIQTATPNYLLTYKLGVTTGVNVSFWDGRIKGRLTLDGTLHTDTLLKGNFKTTLLLTKIINNKYPDAGNTYIEFTYNGKQLTQAVTNYDVTGPGVESVTTNFNYNGKGQFIGTTIYPGFFSQKQYNYPVGSTVTYAGNNISSITFNYTANIASRTVKLTYQNGLLTQLSDPNGLGVTNYAYDNNGNCVKELFIEYSGGQPDGYRFPLTHSTFDTHTSLQTAFPLWIYFQCFSSGKDRAFTTTSSKNNPLASNDSGSAFTYNYSYNIFGYPSTIAFEDNSWIYKYTPVN